MVSSIQWQFYDNWNSIVKLGTQDIEYNFSAMYNYRSQGWYITISTLNDDVIISERLLLLEIDLLSTCNSIYRPDCALIVYTDKYLDRLDYNAMVNQDAKLYHITENDINI